MKRNHRLNCGSSFIFAELLWLSRSGSSRMRRPVLLLLATFLCLLHSNAADSDEDNEKKLHSLSEKKSSSGSQHVNVCDPCAMREEVGCGDVCCPRFQDGSTPRR
eukprot:709675-Hanusia_phi.AAC.1